MAVDPGLERELWTVALKLTPSVDAIDYALWTDPQSDPQASGSLDPKAHSKTAWAARVRDALKGSRGKELDDVAREELVLAILRAHDPAVAEYESRLSFNLTPPDDGSGDQEA